MPPLTAVITPIRVPYSFGSRTSTRSMIRHSGTVGPETPWMMRPTNSHADVRGQGRDHAAGGHHDQHAGQDLLAADDVAEPGQEEREQRGGGEERGLRQANGGRSVCSSFSMVTSAGQSMEALSWNAMQAASRAAISAAMFTRCRVSWPVPPGPMPPGPMPPSPVFPNPEVLTVPPRQSAPARP